MINDKDVENLLLKKQKYIGRNIVDISAIITGVTFIFSNVFATYDNVLGISGNIWKIFAFVVGVVIII